jgi:hypothetical protein
MKQLLIILTVALCLVGTTEAQSYRLNNLSDRLQQQADDLAGKVYDDFNYRSSNTKSDVDILFLSQQFSSSATIFRRMVQDRRRNSELRDAASILVDLSRRFPTYGSNSYQWREAGRTIDDISRELNIGGGGNIPDDNQGPIIGRVRWRGTVDNEINLVIQDNQLEVRNIAGTDYGSGTYNFTSALPTSPVKVSVNKIKGRGSVRVLQQPSKDNYYTTVIQILDRDGGAKEYDVEVVWRR